MNIIQLEDNLKSLPDSNLQNEMTNPTGMFPQYLVMSEIQRREDMRKDYEGRMASNEKTPPLPSMREQMMAGITQSQPPVQDSGIAGLLPAQPQGAPIPPAMSAGPDVMPMYGGGVVGMASGTEVPDLFGLTKEELKAAGLYDDPDTPEDERITSYEQDIMDYYNTLQTEQPEKIEKEKQFGQGLNLLKAGLTLGTAGTFKELSSGLSKTIDSIDASNKAISKKEDEMKKSQLEKAKVMAGIEGKRKDRIADLSKLKSDKLYKEKQGAYMEGLGSKPSSIEQIASDLVERDKDSQTLPIYKETVDPNDPSKTIKVPDNELLYNFANQYQSSIGAAGIRSETVLRTTLDEAMNDWDKSLIFGVAKNEVDLLMKDNDKLTKEEAITIARENFKNRKLIELFNQTERQYSGGVVGKSVQSFNDVVKTING